MTTCIAVTAWLCASAGVAQGAPNLPSNPSFEAVADGLPEGWAVTTNVTATVETDDATDGDRWLRLQREEGSAYALAYQPITVKPNTGYRARAWIRTPAAGHHSLVAYDAVLNGICVASTGWARFPEWTELKLDFRTRETDSVVKIGLLSYAPESHWDGITFVQDDSVRIGDVSPVVNPPVDPTTLESDLGFLAFTRPLEQGTSARYMPLREECLAPDGEIRATCPPGERETVMVMLHALRDIEGARLRVQGLPPGLRADDVALFRIGYSKRELNSQAHIRYPLLLLPPAESEQGHAREDVKRGDVLQHAVRVRVPPDWSLPELRLELEAETERGRFPISIAVTVPRVKLDPADVSFFMYYADVYLTEPMASPRLQRLYYRDMAEHGMTSVSLYVAPERETRGGDIRVELDLDMQYEPSDARHYLGLRQRLALAQAAGLVAPDRPLILLSAGGGIPGWGAFRDPGTVRDLLQRRKLLGWPPLLFYVADEPNNAERVAGVRETFGRLYSQVPEARTVTAIGQYGVEHVGELYDVWIAGVSDVDEATVARAEEMGKELWGYDCNQRGQSPRFDRYACGFYTWSAGLRGLGQWAYYSTEPLTRDADGTWAVPEDWSQWYMAPSEQGPVGTIGWEGRREGVEDYRCLRTLERLCRSRSGAAPSEARALLAEARRMSPVNSFADRPFDDRYIWEYTPAPELTVRRMRELRERMLRLIAVLQAS